MAVVKIAVHQMQSGIDPEKNVAAMGDAIRSATTAGAQCYFAPEMGLLLDRDRGRSAQHIVGEQDNRWIDEICKAAAAAGIWVHLGSLPVLHEDGSGRNANRTLLIDGKGQVQARYDKMHLFDVDLASGESWRESSAYRGGDGPVLAEIAVGENGADHLLRHALSRSLQPSCSRRGAGFCRSGSLHRPDRQSALAYLVTRARNRIGSFCNRGSAVGAA